MARPRSEPLPPRYDEKIGWPEGLNLATKAFLNPLSVACIGLTVGKLGDVVVPTTNAFPVDSTKMPFPSVWSDELRPPKYVEYSKDAPSLDSLATNAVSNPAPNVAWNGFTMG